MSRKVRVHRESDVCRKKPQGGNDELAQIDAALRLDWIYRARVTAR